MCFVISRLTEWNLVAGVFTFPEAPGKQSTDGREGRAVPAHGPRARPWPTGTRAAAGDATSRP